MSLETMTKLASTTVGVGGQASVDFTNIPQGYTDLKVVVSSRSTRSDINDFIKIGFNGLTTNLNHRALNGNGSAVSSGTDVSFIYGTMNAATSTASTFGNSEFYISNYAGNTFKNVNADTVMENNATFSVAYLVAGLWSNSSPITSINIAPYFGLFVQHSTFTLYGIKNARQTAGNSIKATGGNIVFDGTYVYHVFNSTGAFATTQQISADVLVVAGGGGVSTNNNGVTGGGGAGGVIYFARQSLAPNITYSCTVGSGGAASTNGTNGSNSNFSGLTAAVGGGSGGGWSGNAPGNGGSGGGSRSTAGGSSTQTGTGATAFYGNAGGTGNGFILGGGGGGAGAAGASGTGDYAGTTAGGNGTDAFSSWGVATGLGENISGTYYIAGGGAGYNSTVGGYGGGGNGSRANGSPNTGGGGTVAGSGGSGVVVIRYKG